MFPEMFEGLDTLIWTLIGVCVVFVPLGIWKAAEILIWLMPG